MRLSGTKNAKLSIMTYKIPKYISNAFDSTHLEHPFAEAGLLRQLFEVFGVGVVIEGEVGLHSSQLVVLERGSNPLLSRGLRGTLRVAVGQQPVVLQAWKEEIYKSVVI